MLASQSQTKNHKWTPLILRHNKKGPRYTSYPTPLQFIEGFSQHSVKRAIENLSPDQGISLYLHIPFCENICFYCGCNKVITRKKDKAIKYLQYLRAELSMYARSIGKRPVRQIHLGGGTPNFLSHKQIKDLMVFINDNFEIDRTDLDQSIEIDPRLVDADYLQALFDCGFNRLSFGVQDLNPIVQKAVNRVCSPAKIKQLVTSARETGFKSIHIDLIYGLPFQSVSSFSKTVAEVAEIRPDRLSMYNYAHLPSRFPPQRRIKEKDLPEAHEKLNILHHSIDYLSEHGYTYVGMDHFALTDSPLTKLQQSGHLQRNFQGYSTHGDCAIVAVGVSAISQIDDVYVQNHRKLDEYYQAIDAGHLPLWRGYQLHQDDLVRRALIMQLICHGELDLQQFEQIWKINFLEYFVNEITELKSQVHDGLLTIQPNKLSVTAIGWLLIRNICMVFDAYLNRYDSAENFSKAI